MRIGIPVAIGFLAVAFALPRECASQEKPRTDAMREAERLRTDMQATYQLAREQTTRAEAALFLPDQKVGDPDAALGPFTGSDSVLSAFLTRWEKVYAGAPALFAMMDELRARNARGLAYIALAKGDTRAHGRYREVTVDISHSALDHIAAAGFENEQFPWLTEQFRKHLSEAHLYLYIHYTALGDKPRANQHLRDARDAAPDAETKAMIDGIVTAR